MERERLARIRASLPPELVEGDPESLLGSSSLVSAKDLFALVGALERAWAETDEVLDHCERFRANAKTPNDQVYWIGKESAVHGIRAALTGPPAAPAGADEDEAVIGPAQLLPPQRTPVPPQEVCGRCGGTGFYANPVAPRAACPDCHGTGSRMPPETQRPRRSDVADFNAKFYGTPDGERHGP